MKRNHDDSASPNVEQSESDADPGLSDAGVEPAESDADDGSSVGAVEPAPEDQYRLFTLNHRRKEKPESNESSPGNALKDHRRADVCHRSLADHCRVG